MKKDLLYIYMYYLNYYKYFTYKIEAFCNEEKKAYITELFENHLLGKRVLPFNTLNRIIKARCIFGDYFYMISKEQVDFKALLSDYLEEQLENFKKAKAVDITK